MPFIAIQAALLDPRTKDGMRKILPLVDLEEAWNDIENDVVRIAVADRHQARTMEEDDEDEELTLIAPGQPGYDSDDDYAGDPTFEILQGLDQQGDEENEQDEGYLTFEAEVRAEVKRYHKSKGIPIYGMNKDGSKEYNDPLLWWKQRQDLKNVYQLVRRVLCIPATSTSVERVFSTVGNICTKKRACLSPAYLNVLTFLKHNDDVVPWGVPGCYDESADIDARKLSGLENTFDDDASGDEATATIVQCMQHTKKRLRSSASVLCHDLEAV